MPSCKYLCRVVFLQDGGSKVSIERVREYFREKGIEDRIQEFGISSATVALAAKALNCDESRIAKSKNAGSR